MKCLKHILVLNLLILFASTEDPELLDSDYAIAYSRYVNWSKLQAPEAILGIINGREASPHSYPFQVYLEINLKPNMYVFCGGTLITRRFVLTAAHCVKGTLADRKTALNVKAVTVTVGAHDLSKQEEDTRVKIDVRRIKIHENYSGQIFANDIALLELDCPVALGDNVRTVKLAPRQGKWRNLDRRKAITIGWGRTSSTSRPSSVLNEIENVILPNIQCWLKFPRHVRSTNICLSARNFRRSCSGDSGSPLLVDGVQVGITSFGAKNCFPGFPTVFTRITSYLNWIEKNSDYDFAEGNIEEME